MAGARRYCGRGNGCRLRPVLGYRLRPRSAPSVHVRGGPAARLRAGTLTVRLVGLGGSATVDGGLGALNALGTEFRSSSGAAVGRQGAADLRALHSVASAGPALATPGHVEVLADVTTPLCDAAHVLGPQEGADATGIEVLAQGLEDLAGLTEAAFNRLGLRLEARTGAAGGLGFALALLGGELVDGAERVARLMGLGEALAAADLLVVGEGQLDTTSTQGKFVGAAAALAAQHCCPVVAVVGCATARLPGIRDLVEAAADGPGGDPFDEVAAAAAELAGRTTTE